MDLSSASFLSTRLCLKTFAPEDAREVFAAATPTLTRYMSWDPALSVDAFEKIWQKWLPMMVEGTDVHFVVRLKARQEFLGMAGLHNIGASEPDTGIWIKEAKHGNGYGREAVAALISFASRDLGKKAVLYSVAEENRPSWRLAESLNGKIVANRLLRKGAGIEYLKVVYRIPSPS
jgi:RimJ/RimL family protein N-acetyltransferase